MSQLKLHLVEYFEQMVFGGVCMASDRRRKNKHFKRVIRRSLLKDVLIVEKNRHRFRALHQGSYIPYDPRINRLLYDVLTGE